MLAWQSVRTALFRMVRCKHTQRRQLARKGSRISIWQAVVGAEMRHRLPFKYYVTYACKQTHVCTYIYIYIYILHTYIHAYIHTYIHTYIHAYIHTYVHTYIHTYIRAYVHTYMHTYMHTYIHRDMYIFIYIYICIRPLSGSTAFPETTKLLNEAMIRSLASPRQLSCRYLHVGATFFAVAVMAESSVTSSRH